MTKVELIGRYNTTLGDTLVITSNASIKAGERITDGKDIYTVKRVIMSTRPDQNDKITVLI